MTDHGEIEAVQKRMFEAEQRLWKLVPKVATARQVREYDGDRRKNRLARATLPFLEAGDSATAAETKARASESYMTDMDAIRRDYRDAEHVIAEWEAAKVSFESARSVLSLQKTVIEKI